MLPNVEADFEGTFEAIILYHMWVHARCRGEQQP